MNNEELKQDGKYYCSCGCGCLKADYNEAHKKAQALQKKMGKGWQIKMYDIVGWHFYVYSGPLRIGQCIGTKKFWARFEQPQTAFTSNLIVQSEATSPQAALKQVIKKVSTIAANLLTGLVAAELRKPKTINKAIESTLKQVSQNIPEAIKQQKEANGNTPVI